MEANKIIERIVQLEKDYHSLKLANENLTHQIKNQIGELKGLKEVYTSLSRDIEKLKKENQEIKVKLMTVIIAKEGKTIEEVKETDGVVTQIFAGGIETIRKVNEAIERSLNSEEHNHYVETISKFLDKLRTQVTAQIQLLTDRKEKIDPELKRLDKNVNLLIIENGKRKSRITRSTQK